jgi:hypothetical protein
MIIIPVLHDINGLMDYFGGCIIPAEHLLQTNEQSFILFLHIGF